MSDGNMIEEFTGITKRFGGNMRSGRIRPESFAPGFSDAESMVVKMDSKQRLARLKNKLPYDPGDLFRKVLGMSRCAITFIFTENFHRLRAGFYLRPSVNYRFSC